VYGGNVQSSVKHAITRHSQYNHVACLFAACLTVCLSVALSACLSGRQHARSGHNAVTDNLSVLLLVQDTMRSVDGYLFIYYKIVHEVRDREIYSKNNENSKRQH